ncbi:RagB/SusD family nutrient uptake outer membrane protein [Pontibacter roseus]|uniref:RagB/SusD family nutrient uptake outer membrane protein n=1 Tax=Pontibacter roseus TaxID=336989 RepID=UPI000476AC76|nr:RagB/SusD family nutrient uptake outer membrane protein [Pontibacter roseus]
MKNIFRKLSPLALALMMLTSCEKEYLDTKPTDQVSIDTVFETVDGAWVALDGTYRSMYTSLTNHGNFGQKSYDLMSDLMGNDMVVHSAGYGWFNPEYQYTAIQSVNNDQRPHRTWFYYYRLINNANRILDGLETAVGLDADKQNIRGQALAIRANSYFYLVNFWQHTYKGHENAPGVPLYTKGTIEGAPRASVQEIYNQIVADLTEAETLLDGKPRKHISHINAATAKGIRARVALQMEDWATAAIKAREARGTIAPMSAANYQAGFSKPNSEWIWGLEVNTEQATIYASFYSHIDPYSGGYATLGTQKKITKELYDLIPETDIRKKVFVTPGTGTTTVPDYAAIKLRLPTAGNWMGDYILMRAGEMYLIEAEALARQGDNAGAQAVLNTLIKARNAAYDASALTGTDLINEILLQRRIELWGEGFSLLDIKRLKLPINRPTGPGNHDPGLARILTLPAEHPSFLLKIPLAEITSNPAISEADQNPD